MYAIFPPFFSFLLSFFSCCVCDVYFAFHVMLELARKKSLAQEHLFPLPLRTNQMPSSMLHRNTSSQADTRHVLVPFCLRG